MLLLVRLGRRRFGRLPRRQLITILLGGHIDNRFPRLLLVLLLLVMLAGIWQDIRSVVVLIAGGGNMAGAWSGRVGVNEIDHRLGGSGSSSGSGSRLSFPLALLVLSLPLPILVLFAVLLGGATAAGRVRWHLEILFPGRRLLRRGFRSLWLKVRSARESIEKGLLNPSDSITYMSSSMSSARCGSLGSYLPSLSSLSESETPSGMSNVVLTMCKGFGSKIQKKKIYIF